MNIEELERSGKIAFKCLAGSQAYNLHTPTSDKDYRGIFFHNKEKYLEFETPSEQINDDKQNQIYYSLKRFITLASTANPNILELLWMPNRVIEKTSSLYEYLKTNRNVFLSKKIYHTYSGYAYTQTKKARGQKKLITNPRNGPRPTIEDHTFILDNVLISGVEVKNRPIPIKEFKQRNIHFDFGEFVTARVEGISHLYRLYYRGKNSPGVFRDGQLVPESISFDEESRFYALMIFNEDAYKADFREWNNYQEWLKNRNDARWIFQENGICDYDSKNMMHCMRLLLCSEKALTEGKIEVEWNGADRDFLLNIRGGTFQFDELIKIAEDKMENLKVLYEKSSLPHAVNQKEIAKLYLECVENFT